MKARSVIMGAALVAVCLVGLMFGFYTYLGDFGTAATRRDLMARSKSLADPNSQYRYNSFPETFREEYVKVVRAGGAVAQQGCWDKTVMYIQSLLLVVLAVAGLYELFRTKGGQSPGIPGTAYSFLSRIR